MDKLSKVVDTLAARGKHYEGPGGYPEVAATVWAIKEAMQKAPNWATLTPAHKEALHMIANKAARILNGNPNHADSWHDIAGYATLAEKTCQDPPLPPSTAPVAVCPIGKHDWASLDFSNGEVFCTQCGITGAELIPSKPVRRVK